MIRTPPQVPLAVASAWVSGVAGLFLLVGLTGSLTPVVPPLRVSFGEPATPALVQVQEFLAPPGEASPEPPVAEQPQTPPPVQVSIPPPPALTAPLQPPEMVELQMAAPLPEPPLVSAPPKPAPAEPEPKAKPAPAPASLASLPKTTASAAARPARAGGTQGGSQAVPFSAAGGGRFPAPAYPSAARSARVDGTVVLLVTVEASGVPSSVEIRTSSGHAMLDNAARDHVRRNWRWPQGESRLFLVPIKFVLQ